MKMKFLSMQAVKTGIWANTFDLNQTSLCLEHGLDREVKHSCRDVDGLLSYAAGTLFFFQVGKLQNRDSK